MRTGIIIQARLASTRFPGKMLYPLCGQTLVEHVMDSMRQIYVDEYILAVPYQDVSVFIKLAHGKNYHIFGGPEENVLARYTAAVEKFKLDTVISACADKSIISYKYTTMLLRRYFETNQRYDFVYTDTSPFRWVTAAIYKVEALLKLEKIATEKDKIHIRTGFTNNPNEFKCLEVKCYDKTSISLTPGFVLDEREDVNFIEFIYNKFYKGKPLDLEDIIL